MRVGDRFRVGNTRGWPGVEGTIEKIGVPPAKPNEVVGRCDNGTIVIRPYSAFTVIETWLDEDDEKGEKDAD